MTSRPTLTFLCTISRVHHQGAHKQHIFTSLMVRLLSPSKTEDVHLTPTCSGYTIFILSEELELRPLRFTARREHANTSTHPPHMASWRKHMRGPSAVSIARSCLSLSFLYVPDAYDPLCSHGHSGLSILLTELLYSLYFPPSGMAKSQSVSSNASTPEAMHWHLRDACDLRLTAVITRQSPRIVMHATF